MAYTQPSVAKQNRTAAPMYFVLRLNSIGLFLLLIPAKIGSGVRVCCRPLLAASRPFTAQHDLYTFGGLRVAHHRVQAAGWGAIGAQNVRHFREPCVGFTPEAGIPESGL